jgi:hypothetical protein
LRWSSVLVAAAAAAALVSAVWGAHVGINRMDVARDYYAALEPAERENEIELSLGFDSELWDEIRRSVRSDDRFIVVSDAFEQHEVRKLRRLLAAAGDPGLRHRGCDGRPLLRERAARRIPVRPARKERLRGAPRRIVSGAAAVLLVLGSLTLCGLGALALLGAAGSPNGLLRMSPVAPLTGMAWVGIAASTQRQPVSDSASPACWR